MGELIERRAVMKNATLRRGAVKNNNSSGEKGISLEAARAEVQRLRARQDQVGARRLLARVAREHGPAAAAELGQEAAAGGASSGPQARPQVGGGIPRELLDPQAAPPFAGVGAGVRGIPRGLLDPEASPRPSGVGAGVEGLPPELTRPEAAAEAAAYPIKVGGEAAYPIKVGGAAAYPNKVDGAGGEAAGRAAAGGAATKGSKGSMGAATSAPEVTSEAPQPEAVVSGRAADAATQAKVPKARGQGAAARSKASGGAAAGEGGARSAPGRGGAAASEASSAGATSRGGASASSGLGAKAAGDAQGAAAATAGGAPMVGCEHGGGGEEAEQAIREAQQKMKGLMGGDLVTNIKTGLAIANIVPGVGLVSGVAEKNIGFYQDISSLVSLQGDGSTAQLLTQAGAGAVLASKLVLGTFQVALDQASQINQWTDLSLLATGVGAPASITGGKFNEVLTLVSSVCNATQITLDISGSVLIEKMRSNATPGDLEALNSLESSFENSMDSDVLSIVFDVVDAVSLGFAQGDTVKPLAKLLQSKVNFTIETLVAMEKAASRSKNIRFGLDLARGFGQRVIGRWFSNRGAIESGLESLGEAASGGEGSPAPAQGHEACAGEASNPSFNPILEGLRGLRTGHQQGSMVVEWLQRSANDVVESCNEGISELLGAKDPMGQLRDMAAQGLSRMGSELERMHAAGDVIGEASSQVGEAQAQLVGVRALVAGLRVPEIPEPQPSDFGDNLLADLAEGVVDSGLELARAAAQQLREQLTALVEGVQAQAQDELEMLETGISEVQSFLDMYQETLSAQISVVQGRMQSIAEKLAGCEQFDDYLNLLLEQIGEFMGIPGGLGIDVLKGRWAEVGTLLDEAIAHVEELEAERAASEQNDEEAESGGVGGLASGLA